MMKRIALAASLALALAACQDESFTRSSTRSLAPIPAAAMSLMASKGMSKDDPILIRSYKEESEMEVWKRSSNGRYALLKTYPICRWSGQLGPKVREGDRQAPEGFYTITPAQMNPNSSYYLSFNTGFPNAYDRSFGRTGGDLMVHGSCSSRGCFAMTDKNIAEIYAIARESLAAGQRGFQFQSYPFRMTAKNLARHRLDPNIAFWKNLKEGSDYFEVSHEEPTVGVAGRRYVFNTRDPSAATLVAEKESRDEQEIASLVASGVKPVRLVYNDGGSHESFRTALNEAMGADGAVVNEARLRNTFGDVSRPEGLASGPQVVVLDESGQPRKEPPSTALAFAAMERATAPAAAPQANPAPAVAAPAQQAAAPVTVASETPFYKKMLNGIGDLFDSSSYARSDAAPQKTQVAPQHRAQTRSVNLAKAN